MIKTALTLLLLSGSSYANAPLPVCQAPAVCPNYASGIGALPLTGGTITGALTVTGAVTGGSFTGGPISASDVDLSTVTTALALKAALAGAAFTGASSFDGNSPVTLSSAVFMGVTVSTKAAGSAGTSVTATCNTAGTFALGGGCSCSGAVAETANISIPNCVTAGCIANGWTCQVSGGTGGACSAYVLCSRAQ